MLGFHSLGLTPLLKSAISIQLNPPLHSYVTGRTSMEYIFNRPCLRFEPRCIHYNYSQIGIAMEGEQGFKRNLLTEELKNITHDIELEGQDKNMGA
eukprot:14150902-Ditylum_brightwellii.AAC.1